jgi:hypothetical protein
MFGLSYVKLGIIAAIVLAFLGLAWTANHYHEEYIQVREEKATLQLQFEGTLTSLKECSARTADLKKATEEKQAVIEEAQKQAAIVAKSNNKLADKILSQQPKDQDRCKAAIILYKEYRQDTKGK